MNLDKDVAALFQNRAEEWSDGAEEEEETETKEEEPEELDEDEDLEEEFE